LAASFGDRSDAIRHLIEANIRSSFHAFRDDDHDGEYDDLDGD
jgi:hypothetical protein